MNCRRVFVFGVITLMIGLTLLVPRLLPSFEVISVPDSVQAQYVGEDVCFTCHEGLSRNWVDSFRPREIEATISNPHAAASTTSARQVEMLAKPGAYAVSSEALWAEEAQEYVLETETGLLVLPGHYQIGDQVYYDAEPNEETLEGCDDCHAGNFEVSDSDALELERSTTNRSQVPTFPGLINGKQFVLMPLQR
jgi:hypothetical protein